MFGYVGYQLGELTENYYFGLRRYPYSTDMSVNPLSFRDIDTNRTDRPSEATNGPPRNPLFPDPWPNTGDARYNMGEVWCVMLWDARANLIENCGFDEGNDLILRLVTDGMNLTPANPTFLQARDAILLADLVNTGGAELNELWAAFARRGLGWGAASPDASTTTNIVEVTNLPPRGNQVWTTPYITGNAISGSPAIAADGTIYIGSWDGKVYAVNPNKTTKWTYPSAGALLPLRGSPAIGLGGVVYIGCLNKRLYAINPNGTLKWSYLTGGQIYSTPGFGADGTVYFGARDGKVYALDPGTGQARTGWPVTVGGSVDSSPAIAPDGTIYVGAQTYLYALLPNGQVKSGWPKATGNTVYSSPSLARDGTVYITSLDGKLYALNPDGSTNWTFSTGLAIRSSPAIGPEGNIYFGTDGGTVYGVSGSGSLLWTQSLGYYIDSSPAVDAFGNVIIGSWNGVVYALQSADGTTTWSFSTGGLIQSPPVVWTNGFVYIGNSAGHLYGFTNLAAAARSTWPMFRQNAWHTGNPATLTLASGVRQQDGSFQFQINGLSGMNCTVEASENLEAWATTGSVTLSGSAASFTNALAAGYPYQFYRVRSGPILSYNALGYIKVNVPTGFSMIANGLDNAGGNTLGVLMPDMPDLTTLYKWDDTQGWLLSTFYAGGGWDNPDITLNPGEGGWIQAPSATTVTFVGEVPQGTLANPFPAGMSIRSSMVSQSGPIDTLLGFAPIDLDTIYRYNNAQGAWDTYTYYDPGVWDVTPVPSVGESFWIKTTTARTWVRQFNVW